jgi:hypothetical protein
MLIQENDFVCFRLENTTLHIQIKSKIPSDEEWNMTKQFMLSTYTAYIKSQKTFSIVCDLTCMHILPLYRISDWANLFKEKKESTKKCVEYTIFITDSTLVRTSMNIFFQLYEPVRPTVFLSSKSEIPKWKAQNINMIQTNE